MGERPGWEENRGAGRMSRSRPCFPARVAPAGFARRPGILASVPRAPPLSAWGRRRERVHPDKQTMTFQIDPRLEQDSLPILELGLSSLRLMNEARYPWMLILPRVPGVVEILDLSIPDQLRLWDEIRLVSHVLREQTGAAKLNIAALGNQVPQLHIHVIARFPHDDAWPAPVWGVHPPRPYDPAEADVLVQRLATAIRG